MDEQRTPSLPVLEDQWVQDVAAADASPTDKAVMPTVIQHIEEVVLHHQPATPYAPHGIPLSDWPVPITSSTKNIGKPDARQNIDGQVRSLTQLVDLLAILPIEALPRHR